MSGSEKPLSFVPSKEKVDVGLRALKAVAAANGVFDEEERALLQAAAHAFDLEVDPDALTTVSPDEVARAFEEPVWRERLVQAMVIMAVIDGEASKEELAVIREFAGALHVSEPRIKNLEQLMGGHVIRLRFDLLRRTPMVKLLVKQTYEKDGVKGLVKFVRGMIRGGMDANPDLAWRYKQLGLLPEGTLGREFWKHMTKEKFALPGEPGGLAEVAVNHDLTHVLTGYDTDPAGETQIASFYAGYFKEDPFAFVWMVAVMFHLGVKLSPIATPARGQFDPEKVLRAMQRGARMTIDLTDHWDYWPYMEMPIADVRRQLGIAEA